MTLAFALALATALVAGSACGSREAGAPDVRVQWTLTPEPAVVGPAHLEIRLLDSDDAPVDAARVRLEAHMAHPGMAPVLGEAERQAPGVHAVSFAFTMRGDWNLLVTADLRDGRQVSHRIDVRVSGPGA